jgi:hypothetical protein
VDTLRIRPAGPPGPYSPDLEGLEFWLKHVHVLLDRCDQQYNIVQWFISNLIKHPEQKSIMIDLVSTVKRIGKTTVIWLLRILMGSSKVLEEEDAQHVFGNFNGLLVGALLVVLSELDGSGFLNGAKGRLMAMITDGGEDGKPLTINQKGIKPFQVKDYSHWMNVSNNHGANPVESERVAALNCSSELLGNRSHFDHLYKVLFKSERFLRTVWAYYKWRDCPEKLLHEHIPKTGYSQDIQQRKTKLELQFLKAYVEARLAARDALGSQSVMGVPPIDVCFDLQQHKVPSQTLWVKFWDFCDESNYLKQREGYTKQKFYNNISPKVLLLPNRYT